MQQWTAKHWLPSKCKLGEAPTYRASDSSLFFVDIENFKLFQISLDKEWDSVRTWTFQEPVSSIHLVAGRDDVLAVTNKLGFALLHLESGQFETLTQVHEGNETNHPRGSKVRFNDSEIDLRGRWFAGTMHYDLQDEVGALWLYENGQVEEVIEGAICPNGIGWSLDERIMYWTETPHKTIYQFDYDLSTGKMSNKRKFIELQDGNPDGLAVDEEGCVWTAANGTGKILRYSPAGELIGQVTVPQAKMVTCPCFGGPSLTELFITTMIDEDDAQASTGDVYRCNVDIKGRPKNEYRLTAAMK